MKRDQVRIISTLSVDDQMTLVSITDCVTGEIVWQREAAATLRSDTLNKAWQFARSRRYEVVE